MRPSSSGLAGKSAFEWDIYKNRRTALQYLKRKSTLVDTIIETEDGRAHELVHSQVMSAFGDKLTSFMAKNGVPAADRCASASAAAQAQAQVHGTAAQTSGASANGSSAAAAALAATISGASNSKNLKVVRLPRVNNYTLNILVECAYSGYIRTDLASGGIWQVLDVADYYEMEDVIRACCTFLIKNLDRSNCIPFYHIGIKHRHPLQRSAWHQIRANFKHILMAELQRLQQEQQEQQQQQVGQVAQVAQVGQVGQVGQVDIPGTLSTSVAALSQQQQRQEWRDKYSMATIKFEHFEPLLLHDKLNIDNEESVWTAIRMWCQYNLPERQAHLANLLPCMRFPRFRTGTEFAQRHIWRDPLILDNKQAQHQLAVLDRNHRDFLSAGPSAGRLSGGSSSASGGGGNLFRDGFGLPCAVNPRQLRPRIPHSILLAIGGWQQGQPTTLIESYDLNCNLWFESRRRITSPLAYHGIEFINSLLYICGGTDGSEILNEMFTFDPIVGVCSQKASMREARCYVSTSHLDGYLYAMGGHNGHQRMRSVERFDLVAESWAHVHEMNVARSDASACVHGAHVYIAGGLNDQVIESSVEFYNPADDTWTFISSMLMSRTSFTLLNYKNCLLAIGGNNGTDRLNSVEQYSFQTKLWTAHSQMRHRRSTFSAALVDETKLFVVGGYNGQTPFSQVEMWDETSGAWIAMHKIRYDRSGLKVVVMKDLPNAHEYTFLGSQLAIEQYSSSRASTSNSIE